MRIAPARVEDQALEIGRDLDVHRRRGGRHHVAQLVGAAGKRAHQDVVDVGRDEEAIDGQAHAGGDVARKNIAEIPGRHRERDFAVRHAERDGGDEIVDHLGRDAGEVDGVDAGQPHAIAESVVIEHGLHQGLAIVERAFDRDRMDVVVAARRHHAALHVGDAPLRKQRDDVDLVARGEGFDGGATGVA